MSTAFPTPAHPLPKYGEPTWDLALMYPLQGGWSVDDYLRLDTGLLVEYTDGFVRVLPMPSLLHQWIVKFLYEALNRHVAASNLGEVFFAPLPIQMTATRYREPDIVYLRPGRISTMQGHPSGADLVMEVVSDDPDSIQRDYEEKRQDYAAAGIGEYWIVDPQKKVIMVLALEGKVYREHGLHGVGDTASSLLLDGLQVEVADVFARCDE